MKLNRFIVPNVLTILLSVIFILITSCNALDFPAAADDFIIFVRQLHNKFLKASVSEEFVTYFFAPAFGIHTKLSSRLFGLVSYFIFNGINFKFLIIVGNCCYLYMAYFMSDIAAKINKEPFLRVIMLSIFLVPLTINYRPVFITGFPFHILFSFSCFLFLTRKKIYHSYFFFLLSVFSSGSGVFTGLISAIALVFYSFRDKKYIPHVLCYLILFFCSLKFLFSYKTLATSSEINLTFKAICSYLVYVIVFIQQAITPYFIDYTSLPIVYLLFGIAIFGMLTYLLICNFKNVTDSPFFYLSIYVLLAGFLAAIVRSHGMKTFPNVPLRYEHFSVIFVVSMIGLLYRFIPYRKIKLGIGVLFFIFFLKRFHHNIIVNATGYDYDILVSKNGGVVRKLVDTQTYKYLHDFKYNNISQKILFKSGDLNMKEHINSTNIRMLKLLNENEFGLLSFRFKEENEFFNVKLILQRENKTYHFIPHKFKLNKYYCLIAKKEYSLQEHYRATILFEDKYGKYKYQIKRGKKFFKFDR